MPSPRSAGPALSAPSRHPRVACAPNAFKGTLSAPVAAAALAAGVRAAGGEALLVPMADGGDGTLDVLLAAAPGARVERHRVTGPVGRRLVARVGWIAARTAVVELAEASGLRRLRRPDPLRATSRGTGELLLRALEGGANRIIVGVGGSACSDGGGGLLAALGARLLDGRGRPLGPGGGALLDLAAADLSGVDRRLAGVRLEVAVDVRNPLLGERGAANVFAPQKGAGPAEVRRLEAGLARLAGILERDGGVAPSLRGTPGAGAAGGSAYGLAVLGAEIRAGAGLVADAAGLDAALAASDLVITGEGRLDLQTAEGKAPMEVARRSARRGLPCYAVAGSVVAIPEGFSGALSLATLVAPGVDPLPRTARLLRRAATILTAGHPRPEGAPAT